MKLAEKGDLVAKMGNEMKIGIIHLLLNWIEDDALSVEQEILAFAIIGMLTSDDYKEEI